MPAKSSYQGVFLGGKQCSEPLDCPPVPNTPVVNVIDHRNHLVLMIAGVGRRTRLS